MRRSQSALAPLAVTCALFAVAASARAALVVDPNDPRTWQGATVGSFAGLLFGSDTATTRQMIVDGQYLDDGIFDPTGYVSATLLDTPWAQGTSGGTHLAGAERGYTTDLTGVGGYDYVVDNSISVFAAANAIDDKWFQSSNVVGETVYDLGGPAPKAAVFNTIDHGPLPEEAIESTVYLSNNLVDWQPAAVQRVWLEGWQPITGIQWDGFVYAVGLDTNEPFRFVSVVWGGPGAFYSDGDNEINGVMGLNPDFQPFPEPSSLGLAAAGLLAACGATRGATRRRTLA